MPNPRARPTVKVELQVEPSGELISGRMTHDVTDPSSLKPYGWAHGVADLRTVMVERAGTEQRTSYLTKVEPFPGEE